MNATNPPVASVTATVKPLGTQCKGLSALLLLVQYLVDYADVTILECLFDPSAF